MNKNVIMLLVASITLNIGQFVYIQLAVEQTDRAIKVAQDWEKITKNGSKEWESISGRFEKVANDWKTIALDHIEQHKQLVDENRVCRSMLTPQQRGER